MTQISQGIKRQLSLKSLFEYPKHIGFICNQCGRCCGDIEEKERHVLLLGTDADRISEETFLEIHQFAENVTGSKMYIYEMKKSKDGKCFFLKNNQCSIYNIRPLICRFYPFQLKNLGNNRYSFSYTNKCPGIGEGPQHNIRFFENLFRIFMNTMEENVSESRLLG